MITSRPTPVTEPQPAPELIPVSEYCAGVSTRSSQAVTWESVCGFLRKRAGEAFAADRDDEAETLRRLAQDWSPRTAAARAQQDAFQAAFAPDYETLKTQPRSKREKGDRRQPTSWGDYYGVIAMYESEIATWEQAAQELLAQAGQAYARANNGFSGRRDEEKARFLRALAKEFAPLAAEVRQRLAQYRARYRPDVREED